MTIIAGVVHGGRVHLAADSNSQTNYLAYTLATPKIHRLGGLIVGTSGTRRFGNLVARLAMADCPKVDADYWLAESIRKAAVEHGLGLDLTASRYDVGDTLVAHPGGLSMIDSAFGILRMRAPYLAIGSGSEVASGVFYAMTRAPNWKPRDVLRMAMRATAKHCPGVRGPFRFVSTRSGE